MRIIGTALSSWALLVCLCPTSTARNISWSGYNWWVRTSAGAPQGPGPNIFSDSTDNVFVDENGDLHLRITRQPNGKWAAAEVDMHHSLGYGTYEWEVSSRYDQFAPNVVGGLFTYLSPQSVANQTGGAIGNGQPDTPHEIDIEFTGAWGNANLYHTTHDPDIQSPSKNYYQALAGDFTTHRFTWTPTSISWGSYNGHVAGIENPAFPIVEQRTGPRNGDPAVHTYDGPVVPQDLNEIPIINFWISDDNPSVDGPSNGLTHEMIIHSFTYTPLQDSADFNADGDVDGRDFLVWQRGFGTGTTAQQGDANYDGIVNANDLAIWSAQYGGAMLQNTYLVPEPSGMVSLLCFIAFSKCFRWM
jgi:hypothetical protein